MKKTICLIFLICFSLLSGCRAVPAEETESEELSANTYNNVTVDSGFDTVIQLTETTSSKEQFDAHFSAMCDAFSRYNELFDIYGESTGDNIRAINDSAGTAPVKTDPEVIAMLKKAKEFYDLSDGEFDVTMGAVLKIWHQFRSEGIDLNAEGKTALLPDRDELLEAYRHTGWDLIEIDEENSTVFITDPLASLDVGGIAKGYATEQTGLLLTKDGEIHGAINAGGNTRTLGPKYSGTPWNVGITNPSGGSIFMIVSMPDVMSFVTSGDYERFYTADDGKNYHHIIDPQTLYPAEYFHSVSIIATDSGSADCLSTTLFTMTVEQGKHVLEEYRKAHPGETAEAIWIMDKEKAADYEYSFEHGDYCITYTDGLKDRIKIN